MSASAARTPRLPYGFARTQGVLIPFPPPDRMR